MGVVFKATQLRLGRTVALKAIAPQLAGDPDFRARFQREAQLAASIEHPNVIPVYEADELDTGELYIAMRWVQGTDLRELLAIEDRLAPARAVEILAPVAHALAAAHARGLVHRDVKPANVLIAEGGDGRAEHVYLTDFGIARLSDEEHGLTRTGVFVGTLAYAAPERIEGVRAGPAADMYALGCVLFETLTGRPPFNRATDLATINAHLNEPIPSAPVEVLEVPAALTRPFAPRWQSGRASGSRTPGRWAGRWRRPWRERPGRPPRPPPPPPPPAPRSTLGRRPRAVAAGRCSPAPCSRSPSSRS
jgi:serine/threonine protein kinase